RALRQLQQSPHRGGAQGSAARLQATRERAQAKASLAREAARREPQRAAKRPQRGAWLAVRERGARRLGCEVAVGAALDGPTTQRRVALEEGLDRPCGVALARLAVGGHPAPVAAIQKRVERAARDRGVIERAQQEVPVL